MWQKYMTNDYKDDDGKNTVRPNFLEKKIEWCTFENKIQQSSKYTYNRTFDEPFVSSEKSAIVRIINLSNKESNLNQLMSY